MSTTTEPQTAQLVAANPFAAQPDYTNLVNPPPAPGDPIADNSEIVYTSGAVITYSLDRVDAADVPIPTLAGDERVTIEVYSQFKVNGNLHVTKRATFADVELRRDLIVDEAASGRTFWLRVISIAGTWAPGEKIEIVQLPSS